MQKRTLQVTDIFRRNQASPKRIVVNQGGTGSSKTWSLAQLFITRGIEESGRLFSIVGKTLPSLKATAMRDFLLILNESGLYNEKNHNKTNHIYRLGSCEFEFFSADEPDKIHGRKRDYLWMSEADSFTKEDWIQLILRTDRQAFLDYNPASEFHWIYDDVISRDDCEFIQSTYLDNPFISIGKKKEIERLRGEDENYWRIYGLGERGVSEETIYKNWDLVDEIPEGTVIYGLDFGFNNPTALVEITENDGEIWLKELLYHTGLTNADLLKRLNDLITEKNRYIYADSAEPQRIEEIHRAGFNINPSDKSVKDGIDFVKRKKIHILKESINLIKEKKIYKYKRDKNGNIIDEPLKFNDHLMDAERYAIYTHYAKQKTYHFGVG